MLNLTLLMPLFIIPGTILFIKSKKVKKEYGYHEKRFFYPSLVICFLSLIMFMFHVMFFIGIYTDLFNDMNLIVEKGAKEGYVIASETRLRRVSLDINEMSIKYHVSTKDYFGEAFPVGENMKDTKYLNQVMNIIGIPLPDDSIVLSSKIVTRIEFDRLELPEPTIYNNPPIIQDNLFLLDENNMTTKKEKMFRVTGDDVNSYIIYIKYVSREHLEHEKVEKWKVLEKTQNGDRFLLKLRTVDGTILSVNTLTNIEDEYVHGIFLNNTNYLNDFNFQDGDIIWAVSYDELWSKYKVAIESNRIN